MLSIEPGKVSTAELHSLMLGSIGPRPISFASTVDSEGRPNLSPFSFFNMFSANPPILIFSPARRVRDNTTKHTLENILATKEVVINVVDFNIVQQASLSSTEYAEGVNEFEKAGLTMLKSDIVNPFRVAESPVQFECKVNEVVHLGKEGGAGNLVICEVVKMHYKREILDAHGKIDQFKIDLVARMGGNWYTRANKGLFEVEKPIRTLGIGVDQIPKEIKNSKILTGNDLGKLGNVEKLPSAEEVCAFIQVNKNGLEDILRENNTEKIHQKAQEYLNKNDVESGWKTLLAQKMMG
ncbi:MAG TPA: flavin reductase family protein [Flavobacteriaceae bacterium]|nr:flavin reductase family protein [Flavobacteriaceae bacterium]